jgi:hypothetical protein
MSWSAFKELEKLLGGNQESQPQKEYAFPSFVMYIILYSILHGT